MLKTLEITKRDPPSSTAAHGAADFFDLSWGRLQNYLA